MSDSRNTLISRFFELEDVRPVEGRSWIPLRQDSPIRHESDIPGVGGVRSYSGTASLAVAHEDREVAEELTWTELDVSTHRPWLDDGVYRQVDLHYDWTVERRFVGIRLVIARQLSAYRQAWDLIPDVLIALELEREDDTWYRPSEGWAEVARLRRDAESQPVLLERRAEMLSDYLSARGMSLYLSSYYERSAFFEAKPAYTWSGQMVEFTDGRDSYERYVTRAGAPPEPRFKYRASGALWRTEWFQAAGASTRVRGDPEQGAATFAVGPNGDRKSPAECVGAMTYLAFRPTLVAELMRYRGGSIGWYSRDTGGLGAATKGIHFGVNSLGLITIFAKDIADIDPWEQRIWAAHSIPLDGGVSEELFDTQMNCRPANTKAPETQLPDVLKELGQVFSDRFEGTLFHEHDAAAKLLRGVHRFRAVEHDGLLALAKDLNRLAIEPLDVELLRAAAGAPKEKVGSLKALERLAAQVIGTETARLLMAPLFGIYDLRIADAHLGSSLIESGLARAKVDPGAPPVQQGRQLLETFVDTISQLTEVLRQSTTNQVSKFASKSP